MFGLRHKDEQAPQSGQQRRAAANRKADRDGHAEIGRYPSSRSTTAWHADPPRPRWRRSN